MEVSDVTFHWRDTVFVRHKLYSLFTYLNPLFATERDSLLREQSCIHLKREKTPAYVLSRILPNTVLSLTFDFIRGFYLFFLNLFLNYLRFISLLWIYKIEASIDVNFLGNKEKLWNHLFGVDFKNFQFQKKRFTGIKIYFWIPPKDYFSTSIIRNGSF